MRHANISAVYTMNGVVLKSENCETDLGVEVNTTLKPSGHRAKAIRTASQILWQILRLFHYRQWHFQSYISYTYVRPHVEFIAPAWSPWRKRIVKSLKMSEGSLSEWCQDCQMRHMDVNSAKWVSYPQVIVGNILISWKHLK